MAIVKMKKLYLLAVRSKKDALLQELIEQGCVEFSEIESQVQGSEFEGLLKREDTPLMSLKSQHATLVHGVDLLNKYSPAKSKLLSAPPEVEDSVLLDDSNLNSMLNLAAKIEGYDDRIKRICGEESRQKGIIESLKPWLDLDMPLDTEGTERTGVLIGTVPTKTSLSDLTEAISAASQEAELFPVSEDKNNKYIVIVAIKEDIPALQECLRAYNFTQSAMSGMNGTAQKCTLDAQDALKELASEKESCIKALCDEVVHRDELKLAADRASTKIALAEAEGKLYGTDSVVMMEGWMPEDKEQTLSEIFARYDCAWDTREPKEDEYPDVPVKLKNNKVTNALNMVTNMYSLPAYGTVDPNPLMAPFFILFYGLMFADIGYGALMIIASLVVMKKMKPRAGMLSFTQLLCYCGISTLVMGILTGGCFGDAPYQIVHMFNPASTWQGLPYLFSPVHDSNTVLYGSLILGVIHLNAGMVINFVEKVKAGNVGDAIFDEGSLWVVLVGIILMALKLLHVTDALFTPGLVVLIVGVLMLLFGAGRHKKGFGKITAAFGCIYNTLTGWFGDILSYARIMALMLAGGVVAQVFNSIAVMPAASMGANVFTVIIFLLIFLVGQALNFALNLLGCFVHDLRLQCLEFFGHFYVDGGRPFEPLSVKSKYVRVKEN